MPAKDAEVMAHAWIEILNEQDIPHRHYEELYRRAIGLRVRRIGQGMQCDDFTAELMAACWEGLRRDIRQREIESGRVLTANAESVCSSCGGSGFKPVGEGRHAPVTKCNHDQ